MSKLDSLNTDMIMKSMLFNPVFQCSPFASKIDKEQLSKMLPAMRCERWPRGYYSMIHNSPSQQFYILLKGRVKIGLHHVNNGRELTLFLLGPGDGFDIMGLIDGSESHYQITALDDVEVLSAPIKQWQACMAQYPSVRKFVEEYAAKQIQRLRELAGALALDDTMTRLIHMLLRHYDTNQTPANCNLIYDLSQEELSQLIGTVRPVIARLLGKLKRNELIEIVNGNLHIIDKQGLLEMVDGDTCSSTA